ncbi:MAG TPA: hypothetical protein VIB79_08945 [Candidatus Binatia bacterium]
MTTVTKDVCRSPASIRLIEKSSFASAFTEPGISAAEWYGDPVWEYELIVMPNAKFLAMLTLAKFYLDFISKQRLGYRAAIEFVLVTPFIKAREHTAMRTRERL